MNNVVLIETDEAPRITVSKSYYKKDILNKLFINFTPNLRKIYIPENSINYEFDVNLKN